MLIKCPKCRSVYDLPDDLISDAGLKMRCCECSEIWVGYPEDALKKINTTPKNIQKMFQHLSKETNDLFVDEKNHALSVVEKVRKRGTYKKSNVASIIAIILSMLATIILLYAFRYDIVRLFPQAENFYSKINIPSIHYGTHLELKNITTKEYTEHNISQIEISGTVVNLSKYVVELPPVKIEILDKEGNLLLNMEEQLSLPRLEAGYQVLFKVVVTNPTPYAKSVYVTFKDTNNQKR